jgi:membrane-bound metal-dependent hydrolase YbcI (DUF457 family)
MMPLTPFHLGPTLLLGVLLYRWLDLPTLLVGSVIVDVRAALVVFGPFDGPVHGILTTFAGGTMVALMIGAVVFVLPQSVQSVLNYIRLADTTSVSAIFGTAIVGVYSHIILDSLLYTDTRPFYPSAWNPFFIDGVRFIPVYGGCALAGVLGLIAFTVRYRRDHVAERSA